MSRTIVAGYSTQSDAVAAAANYNDDHEVIVIGPTGRVEIDRDDQGGTRWDGPLFLVIATKDRLLS